MADLVPTPSDDKQQEFGFGKGGVPLPLLLLYLSFLVFFVWYALEYQLPEFLDHGPIENTQAQSIPE